MKYLSRIFVYSKQISDKFCTTTPYKMIILTNFSIRSIIDRIIKYGGLIKNDIN